MNKLYLVVTGDDEPQPLFNENGEVVDMLHGDNPNSMLLERLGLQVRTFFFNDLIGDDEYEESDLPSEPPSFELLKKRVKEYIGNKETEKVYYINEFSDGEKDEDDLHEEWKHDTVKEAEERARKVMRDDLFDAITGNYLSAKIKEVREKFVAKVDRDSNGDIKALTNF